MNAFDSLVELITKLINSIIGWIDKLFGFATIGVTGFPKLVMYGLLLWIASKVFKIKVNANVGK